MIKRKKTNNDIQNLTQNTKYRYMEIVLDTSICK